MTIEIGAEKSITVLLSADGYPTSLGKVTIKHWHRQERIRRASKILGLAFLGASISVLIPLAHFLLVPSFLIGGGVIGYRAYQEEESILGGEGACPKCQKPFHIEKTAERWPLKDLCSECQTFVSVAPQDPSY